MSTRQEPTPEKRQDHGLLVVGVLLLCGVIIAFLGLRYLGLNKPFSPFASAEAPGRLLAGASWMSSNVWDIRDQDGTLVMRTPYWSAEISLDGPRVVRLSADGAGEARYGANLLANFPGGAYGGTGLHLDGGSVNLVPSSTLPQLKISRNDTEATITISAITRGPAVETWVLSLRQSSPELRWRVETRWEQAGLAKNDGVLRFIFAQRRDDMTLTGSWWPEGPCEGSGKGTATASRMIFHDYPLAPNSEVWTTGETGRGFLAFAMPNGHRANLLAEAKGKLLWESEWKSGFSLGILPTGRSGREAQPMEAGTVETGELTLTAIAPGNTPWKLHDGALADPELQTLFARQYSAWANGAVLADPRLLLLGNEPGGYFFSLTLFEHALALAAGEAGDVPWHKGIPGPWEALKATLRYVAGEQAPEGYLTRGGLRGVALDNECSFLIALWAVARHDPDQTLLKELLPAAERAAQYLITNAQANGGVLITPEAGEGQSKTSTCWFDVLRWQGRVAYLDALFCQAIKGMADLEEMAGNDGAAAAFHTKAKDAKKAFVEAFWRPKLFTHGGLVDYIDPEGKEHAAFYTPPAMLAVAFGLLDPEQGKALLASMDARLGELEGQGWCRWGLPLNLFDAEGEVKEVFRKPEVSGFGHYMNGGIFPEWTGWEILARSQAGDAEGAAKRLQFLAQRLEKDGLMNGTTAWTMDGKPETWIGEPLLSTQVFALAAPYYARQGGLNSLKERPHGTE